MEFKITKVAKDGKADVLDMLSVSSTPKLVVKAGQEGQIKIGDENEENGVFCTALVKETDASIEAITSVTVKEKGSEKMSNSQSVTMKK